MRTMTFQKGVSGVVCALAAVFVSPSASGQVLNESAKLLASDTAAGDGFGRFVSIAGDVAVVGAFLDGDNGPNSGSAYVFRWNGTSWVQEQKLLASDGAADDVFGGCVSVSGGVAIVAAPYHDDNGSSSGSAYVFRYDPVQTICGQKWCEEQKLLASDGAAGDEFGHYVSVSGDVAVVGANVDDGKGSAYVLRYDPAQTICGQKWCEEQKLLASDGAAGDFFGVSVSVSGGVAVVGANQHDDNGSDSGSAYVFRWNGSSWVQGQKLLASDGAAGDGFGGSLSVSGDVAIVGAVHDDNAGGTDAGSAYVFRWNGSSWVQEQKLLASDGAAGDVFGVSVSVSGGVAVVGAAYGDGTVADSGSAYVFRWNGSSWVQEQKLRASDGTTNDIFAQSVSVSSDVAVVGAYWDDDKGTDSGSAYVFNLDVGTCCISNGSCEATGNCQENVTEVACLGLGGRFFGPNLSCTEVCANGACIPTVSAWGIVVLLLLLTTAGTIMLALGRVPAR